MKPLLSVNNEQFGYKLSNKRAVIPYKPKSDGSKKIFLLALRLLRKCSYKLIFLFIFLNRILNDMRVIAADWMGNTSQLAGQASRLREEGVGVPVTFRTRPAAPTAAQVASCHCFFDIAVGWNMIISVPLSWTLKGRYMLEWNIWKMLTCFDASEERSSTEQI